MSMPESPRGFLGRHLRNAALVFILSGLSLSLPARAAGGRSATYAALQAKLASGWNTWNTRSVLSHVLLPEGFALNLAIKEYEQGGYLKETLIGRMAAGDEVVRPGLRAYDGSYTDLSVSWRRIDVRIQTAVEDGELVILATSSSKQRRTPLLVAESGFLWNRKGELSSEDGVLAGRAAGRTIRVYSTKESAAEPFISAQTPYLALAMDGPVGLSTGRRRSLEEISAVVERRRRDCEERFVRYGDEAWIAQSIQTVLAWDTIYDPLKDRVVSPVSRLWNLGWAEGAVGEQSNTGDPQQYLGLVLFCWDTYFAGYLASLDNKELGYANVIEITREKTAAGFVPMWYRSLGTGIRTEDRSQPPVGSIVAREIYRRYGESWFLEEIFDDLLAWNRWWPAARSNGGFLSWGSVPYAPVVGFPWEIRGVGDHFGAVLESGMDNLPVYDDVPYNPQKHLLESASVGLMSLYVADCDALADIAAILGRGAEEAELKARAAAFRTKLAWLWDEKTGLFLDRRTDTGEFIRRISPVSFYPLLAGAATPAQADRMIREHFADPAEFAGDWILPAVARNDPAFKDNDYWRGRIWAPLNFLVYLGLRKSDLPQPRIELARKSEALLKKEWLEKGHIHENYNAETGEGCDVTSSDRFYHWGGLLGIPALMEKGFLAGPETPLKKR